MSKQADGRSVSEGRRRTKMSKGDLREQALLDATEELLRRSTVAEMTMEAVAKEAGITRSAAYFYFASKEDLVHAVIERATRYIYTGIEASAKASDSTGLQRAIDVQVDNWRRHGHIFRVGVELSTRAPYRQVWVSLMEHGIDLACQAVAHDRARGLVHGDPEQDRAQLDAIAWMGERTCYLLFTRDHSDAEEEQLRITLSTLAHRALGYIATD
ncbi:TetR/AcrR family transcriptional regulator [Streptomyces sp. A1499]|uniref:TetR/AcrR family transcriptional regulator n=1 Tax=Streptomyces sp. A1499 TaxID=2563104 RepID=UPI00109E5DF2|nr:TetR/AcrR family transcriptional regulator [Streptomyces sp. A1499]THC54829.1 TetR/AcrR family transcriptional regulator [Streptomyces sp. A1499]